MAKRRKAIKRIYERGREKTVSSTKKHSGPMDKSALRLLSSYKDINRPTARPAKAITKPRLQKPVVERPYYIDNYELPSSYGTTRLTLMVKDPFWIYAYWEIAPDSLSALKKKVPYEEIEKANIVLRMYDVTMVDFNGTNANNYFDIEVGHHANNWHIELWHDNVSYVGELGLRLPNGRFLALSRSNYVHTPRMSYSPRTEQIWMYVTDEKYAYPPYPPIAHEIKTPKTKKTPLIHGIPAVAKKGRVVRITEEDVKRYYGKLSPLLRDIILARASRLYKKDAAAFILEGETAEEGQRIFRLFSKDYLVRKIALGSSQELVLLGGASEGMAGKASEFVEEKIKEQPFFFELATELIVYGRTEPNAQLWLKDKKIELRKDGTFTLRFALPDGKLPLEFKAVSYNKKAKRKISTKVERSTYCED